MAFLSVVTIHKCYGVMKVYKEMINTKGGM